MEIKTLLLSVVALLSIAGSVQLLKADPKHRGLVTIPTLEAAPLVRGDDVSSRASNTATAANNVSTDRIEFVEVL